MDPQTFDALITRLATTQVTRGNALRGLVASAAAAKKWTAPSAPGDGSPKRSSTSLTEA